MSNPIETLKAILSEKLPDEQVQALMAELTIAFGNGSVAIAGSAADSLILTGNNNKVIHHGFRVEDIQAIVREIHSLQSQPSLTNAKQPNQALENKPFALNIETQTVELINSRLAAIQELQKVGQFSSDQKVEFNKLKEKVYSLGEMSQELKLLADSVNRMLNSAVESLTAELSELDKSRGESFIEARSQVCLREQIELLKQFQAQLDEGKTVAHWLNRQRSQNLAQDLGQYALDAYPKIKETISPRRLEAFYFSLGQFLERLSHCLTWGRANSLTDPVTPVVVDDEVYATAFEHLKTLIPDRFSNDGIEQLKEYIDGLVQNLPTYRHLSID